MISKNIITFIGTKEEEEIIDRFLTFLEALDEEDYENVEKLTRREESFYDKVDIILKNFKVE